MLKSWRKSAIVVLFVVIAYTCARSPGCAQTIVMARTSPAGNGKQRACAAAPASLLLLKQGAANSSNTGQAGMTPATLTAAEKMRRAFKVAFLSPGGYAFAGITAAITEAHERRQPQKSTDDRVADGFSRFAINFGTLSADTLLGDGLYAVLLKQDPRYRPSGKHGFGPRALYAASRVFVAYGDDGRKLPNYSRLGGSLSASALANIWERSTPGHDRIGVGPTFRRFGTDVGFTMLQNILLREFWPDIKRKLGHK